MHIRELETPEFFEKFVKYIDDCSDTIHYDSAGHVFERGITLTGGFQIMVSIETGWIIVYTGDDKMTELATFDSHSKELYALAELFEQLFADWGNNGQLLDLKAN